MSVPADRPPGASPGDAAPGEEPRPTRSRDPERSRRAILEAAKSEFCQYGFTGARTERIARKSKINIRMIYHYFGNKEGLYLAVLESVYGEIRAREQQLDLARLEPMEGMRRLILFTFDFFASRRDFIALIANENILRARYLKRLPSIQAMTVPLVEAIRDLLRRGEREGLFRSGVDPVQLYVSIVAQSQLHVSNRYTLSVLFNQDLGDPGWLAGRRAHSLDLIMGYLTARPEMT